MKLKKVLSICKTNGLYYLYDRIDRSGEITQFLINLFGEEATGVIDGAITILQTVWNILSGFIEFVNTYVRPIVEQIFSFIVGTVLPQIAQAFAEWAPTIASILQGLAEVVSTIATAIMAVIQFLMPTIQSIIGVALETIKGVVSGALTAIKGLVDVFAGIFTGDWTRVWEGVKSIWRPYRPAGTCLQFFSCSFPFLAAVMDRGGDNQFHNGNSNQEDSDFQKHD